MLKRQELVTEENQHKRAKTTSLMAPFSQISTVGVKIVCFFCPSIFFLPALEDLRRVSQRQQLYLWEALGPQEDLETIFLDFVVDHIFQTPCIYANLGEWWTCVREHLPVSSPVL